MKTYLNIDPKLNTWKQRLTVVLSTLLGRTYHMTVTDATLLECLNRIIQENTKR